MKNVFLLFIALISLSINEALASFAHSATFNQYISSNQTTSVSKDFIDYIATDHIICVFADAYVANTNEARLSAQAYFQPIGAGVVGSQVSTSPGNNNVWFSRYESRFFKEGTSHIIFTAEKLGLYGCSAFGWADIHW